MPLESYLSEDIFLHHTPSTYKSSAPHPALPPKARDKATPPSRPPLLIFFIPGNPGLLGYYHEFLSYLTTTIATSSLPQSSYSSSASSITIAGFSLGGFDVSKTPPIPGSALAGIQHPLDKSGPGKRGQAGIYSLQEQIELTSRRIDTLVAEILKVGDGDVEKEAGGASSSSSSSSSASTSTPLKPPPPQPKCTVLLIGHSVGAYIALEVMRLLRAKTPSRPTPATAAESLPAGPSHHQVAGLLLLTPTIIDIALSPSGLLVTPLLSYLPLLDRVAQWAAWCVTRALPSVVLESVVARVTGMSRPAAEGGKEGQGQVVALRTTLAWLKSGRGVRQTVGMAGEEMRDIQGGSWGGWGVLRKVEEGAGREQQGEEEEKAPRLVCYFAKEDHWVADETREGIVRMLSGRRRVRGGDSSIDTNDPTSTSSPWPRVEIDESGKLVHGWCIAPSQSKEVAEKVGSWIREMLVG